MTEAPDELPEAGALPRHQQLKILLIVAAVALVVAMLWLGARALLVQPPPAETTLPPGVVSLTPEQMAGLKTQAVGYDAKGSSILASGAISVDDTLSTPVFMPYGGQVSAVFVENGNRVGPGADLLRVRTGDIVDARNALFGAQAQRASALAAEHLAETNAARQGEIYRTAGGALKDYQQAQNDLVAARANLRTADSALGAARDKLTVFGKSPAEIGQLERASGISGINAETVLHAPRGGVIVNRAVSPGQYVTSGAGTPVFTIADLSRVWLIAQIAESDAPHVALGDKVDVTTPAWPGRVFAARIDNVASALDPTSHRLPVRASIANGDGALKPQMFASFAIQRGNPAQPALIVPAMAVIHEGDTARVWVVTGRNLIVAREVRTGDSHDGQVTVLSGLKAGERIVTEGAIFVNQVGIGE